MPKCKPHKKVFSPTDACRKYAPIFFDMAIQGKSLRVIAPWLDSQGVKTLSGKPWNEIYLGHLMKNTIFYGYRRNSGQLETEPVITYSVWEQANAALKSRIRAGRSTVKREKALLRPECGNPDCDATGQHPSPMYRGGEERWRKYYCAGTGPQRRGCGNAIFTTELDARVVEAMTVDHVVPHPYREFIPGDNRSDEIGKLRERGAEAMKHGDYDEATDYMRQAKELEALPLIAPHWENTYRCHTCGHVKDEVPCIVSGHQLVTEGEYFASLDTEARRNELAENWIVSAWRRDDGEIALTVVHKSFT
jgi:hypothetical protein